MENPQSPFTLAKYLMCELSTGKNKRLLSKTLSISPDYINKHLWLNTWPTTLIETCKLYSDIFTHRVLFNIFASRRKYYSKENFSNLKNEIALYIQKGAKHKPKKALNYPKSRAGGSLQTQRIRQEANKNASKIENIQKKDDTNFDFENLLYYQQVFKDILGLHVVVQYSNSKKAGEVRINFKEVKDLEYLIDRMS